jgi:hypothetical protein
VTEQRRALPRRPDTERAVSGLRACEARDFLKLRGDRFSGTTSKAVASGNSSRCASAADAYTAALAQFTGAVASTQTTAASVGCNSFMSERIAQAEIDAIGVRVQVELLVVEFEHDA